jgi:hypothetical protein
VIPPRTVRPPDAELAGRAEALRDGLLSGAVGTFALDAVTYLDMTLRARPPSHTPEESVRRLAGLAHTNLGPGQQAGNRRAGLGPLLGYATGLGTAVAFAMLAGRRRPPTPVAAGLLAGAALIASNLPMTLLRITDPRRWSRADWLADIVPHLSYGVAAATTWSRLRRW